MFGCIAALKVNNLNHYPLFLFVKCTTVECVISLLNYNGFVFASDVNKTLYLHSNISIRKI